MKNEPATDKQVNEMLEAENAKLKKEIERLHGRLGAQGAAIAREEKYKHLEFELKQMATLYEKQLEKAESLRDMFAAKAMQAYIQTHDDWCAKTHDDRAKMAYSAADAMLKQREKKDANN